MLWPAIRKTLAERRDDLALLAALEAEHQAIDPLLDAIDADQASAVLPPPEWERPLASRRGAGRQ